MGSIAIAAKSIGFVPTMGYLHEGHLALVRQSVAENDVTAASIFVNPAQFAAHEDLSTYPRNEVRDLELLESAGCDIVFLPQTEEIYPENFQTYVLVDEITKILEGEFRPTHFKGVTTVVAILLNLSRCTNAYFGRKDAQQAAVISRMVKDLFMPCVVHICPIVREPDGLAMSSRNIYLDEKDRANALTLFESLKLAEELVYKGERDTDRIKKEMLALYGKLKDYELQYIAFTDAESFAEIKEIETEKPFYILIACRIGKTRLIDNFLLTV